MASNFLAATPRPYPDPRATIEAFCKSEFDGNEDAFTMVSLSLARQKEFHKKYPGEIISIGNMISGPYDSIPVQVVNSYRITNLTVTEDTAVATVDYDVVGEFKNDDKSNCANKFVLSDNKLNNVLIKLRYNNGKNGMGWIRGRAWYIEDPSCPKISKEALLRLCLKKVAEFQEIGKIEKREGRPVLSNIASGIKIYKEKADVLQNLNKAVPPSSPMAKEP